MISIALELSAGTRSITGLGRRDQDWRTTVVALIAAVGTALRPSTQAAPTATCPSLLSAMLASKAVPPAGPPAAVAGLALPAAYLLAGSSVTA